MIILILTIGIGVVSANDNTTQTLTETPTNTLTDNGKTFTDIQKQIDAAGENATIELEGEYTGQGKKINIKKPITITSKNGATLNAKSKSNIFNIGNVNVCIKNINFINSKSSIYPAIYSQGNLTVLNSNFTNNMVYDPNGGSDFEMEYSTMNAGAIFSTNNLNVVNCEFDNNHATKKVYNYETFDEYITSDGGSITSRGNLQINNSIFKKDPIYSYENLSISNSKFLKDTYLKSKGKLNISHSEFTDSIISFDGITSITESIFKKSNLYVYSDINITDCNFTDFYDAIYAWYEFYMIRIDNCNFNNAGIYSNSRINVYNSTFSKNSDYAIDCDNATIINSTFKDNNARTVSIHSKVLSMENCSFINNTEGTIYIKNNATINGKNYTGPLYLNDSLIPITEFITATTAKLTTTYNSGKTAWVKLTFTKSKNPVKNTYIEIRINGKYFDYDEIRTNSKGIAYYKASNLDVGTYKLIFNYDDGILPQLTTTVKITKAKTIIKAPKVTNKYKKSKYFQVTVKNKATKKAVKYTYVKVKIDKKTYKIKTNSKGIAKFNTKKLKTGKHKVTITSGNSNYLMSGKSTIVIKK
ncbi:right-handed parallel beta-helix repeat-containing protein [uncultured Methanobrevibacter sp.]|uniref:right-handed parallel beta-helix repeat-containing protein n=1 Tax=uncultured Methanobrevibacter sp. TaxID=253161 RepID=UPI00262F9A14|nr:right-handed parallel beta-helix repeat-containing protein [uncultured Methanobrevibacter sp.]